MTSEIETSKYVWYAGYGSNLFRERFNYYILGGQFPWGGKRNERCEDPSLPKESRPFIIHHKLFFANRSSGWNYGGVAFISPKPDKNTLTYGRMWKITSEQFSHIWKEEGNGKNWYHEKIKLGQDEEGIPIYTITNISKLESNAPSKDYLKTIIAGLKETYQLSDKSIFDYLISKDGVGGNFTKQDIITICQST